MIIEACTCGDRPAHTHYPERLRVLFDNGNEGVIDRTHYEMNRANIASVLEIYPPSIKVWDTPCPVCSFPMVWVDAAPGPSEFHCKVCELRAENELVRESRSRFHDLLITAFEKLVAMGYPIEDFPGMTPDLLAKTWKQVRDHESYS